MKKSGYQSNSEYGELRYLANPIRGLLIKSGYKVVQAKATVAAPNQGDEFFDIVKRIKAGDFGDATMCCMAYWLKYPAQIMWQISRVQKLLHNR